MERVFVSFDTVTARKNTGENRNKMRREQQFGSVEARVSRMHDYASFCQKPLLASKSLLHRRDQTSSRSEEKTDLKKLMI